MARDARGIAPRSIRPWAFAFALLGAAFGAGAARLLGRALGSGFRFDWYRYVPPSSLGAGEAAVVIGVVVLVPALLLSALGTSLGARFAAREGPRARSSGARSRSLPAHGLRVGAAVPLPLAAGAALVALLVFAAGGLRLVDPAAALPTAGTALGAAAGFASGYLAFVAAARGVASGAVSLRREGDNVFSRVALWCARNARVTLALVLAATLVAGYGATLVHTNVDVADVLPRGNPHTAAAQNLTERFKSSFTLQVTLQFRVCDAERYAADAARLPHRATRAEPGNVTDEVYVRAIDQFLDFAKRHVDPATGAASPFTTSLALPDFYRAINWTFAGGRRAPASSYALPSAADPVSAAAFAGVHRGVWSAIPQAADALVSPDYRQTAALLLVSPQETLSPREIGEWALRVREAYVAWASDPANGDAYRVFTGENAPAFTVDLPLANAHSSALAARDFGRLLPVLAAWIVVCVLLAFRSLAAVAISMPALAVSVLWTLGVMGWVGIPLNTLNLTVIPLMLGVGIDYGIHAFNEYQEGRSRGLTLEDAFRRLGRRGFVALFVATLNTIVGLAVMIASPSLLIAQLGFLAIVGIASSFVATLTLFPAGLSLLPAARRHDYRPSPVMAGIARAVSGRRLLAAAAIVVLTVSSFSAHRHLAIEEFGDPPRNWLPDDPLRMEHERALAGFYASPETAVKANILIFEGDMSDPATHRYMDAIEAALKTKDRVITDTLRSLPFIVRTYLTIRDGAPGVATYLARDAASGADDGLAFADPYPRTRAELEALLEESQRTPVGGLGTLFYDYPENRMGTLLFSVRATSFEDAREVWTQVESALAQAERLRPEGMQVAFFGNTAINYLFVEEELPWVAYMSVVDNLLVMAFVYVPTRSWRATLVVGALNFLASVWWLAVLPGLGVGLAITLTLPLVFIYAIGSDYGLHLVLHAEHSRDTAGTFRTTGKAILFSGITTLGAFLIYTEMSNLAVKRTMLATAAAIPVIFLATVLLVPLLYPARGPRGGGVAAVRVGAGAPVGDGTPVEVGLPEAAGGRAGPPR